MNKITFKINEVFPEIKFDHDQGVLKIEKTDGSTSVINIFTETQTSGNMKTKFHIVKKNDTEWELHSENVISGHDANFFYSEFSLNNLPKLNAKLISSVVCLFIGSDDTRISRSTGTSTRGQGVFAISKHPNSTGYSSLYLTKGKSLIDPRREVLKCWYQHQ